MQILECWWKKCFVNMDQLQPSDVVAMRTGFVILTQRKDRSLA